MKRTHILTFIFFIVVVAIPIFGQLDHKPVQIWDEARNGVSTVEMMQNGNYFVRHFDHNPDEWEVKPPMLMWLSMPIFKVFGVSVLSLRLVSALSMLGICWLLFWFFKKEFKDDIGGAAAAMMLVSSESMMRPHLARTGDHDALLCFLLLGSLITFFKYLKYEKGKYLLFTALLTAAAVLTKSIVGLFYAAGFSIFCLISWQNLLKTVRSPWFAAACLALVGIVGGYYAIAEMMHKGHFTHVWNMELLPRYTNQNPAGQSFLMLDDPFYYVNKILEDNRFSWWWLAIPSVLFLFGWETKDKKILTQICWVLVIFLSILIAKGCANDWYDAPIFVPLSILGGMVISRFVRSSLSAMEAETICILPRWLMIFVIFGAFFGIQYYQTTFKILSLQEKSASDAYAPTMRSLLDHHRNISDNYHVVFTVYPAPIYFSMHAAREKGVTVTPHQVGNETNIKDYPTFKIGDKILTSEQKTLDELMTKYEMKIIFAEGPAKLLEIYAVKNLVTTTQ